MKPLLVLALLLLGSCSPLRHTAQAPPRARRTYHQAERRHARHHLAHALIFWN